MAYRITTALAMTTLLCGACGAPDSELPHRRDCIVEFELRWVDGVDVEQRRLALDGLFGAEGEARKLLGLTGPMPLSLPIEHPDRMYVQFSDRCAQRFQLARQLAAHVERDPSTGLSLNVVERVVEPSVDTIDAWGPSWADSPNDR